MAFPPRSELEFLIEKEIARIAFEPCGVHFIWWGGGEIHAMQSFEHRDQDGVIHQFGEGMWRDPSSLLHRLVQRKVVALHVNDRLLTLSFDDGQALSFTCEDGRGENGLIQFGNDLRDGWLVF